MRRSGRLLVVDDDESNRDALSRRLEQKGYTVTAAVGGHEALALVDGEAYDLVLLDVDMPGLSGFDVLTRIRGSRTETELPVIMVTGRTRGTDIVEAFRLGANDYVTKPIDIPVALARIETHVSHKRAVERLRASEERYALAVQGANDGLWDWDLTTNEVHWSARWKEMVGCDDAGVGTSPDEWFRRVHADDLLRVKNALDVHLANGTGFYECEHRLLHRSGGVRWVLCRGAAIRNAAGVATRLAGSFTDITGAKLADRLTGLPNRLLFVDLLDRAIKRARRRPTYRFALLVLGLDRFKTVNDSLGRASADRLLVGVAHRLQADLRCTDAITRAEHGFTLARLGEDEFTVLLDDIQDVSDVVRVAERLRTVLQQPFEIAGQRVFISASAGIAVSGSRYEEAEEILRDAAIALHRAKTDGTTPCELFDPDMRRLAVARIQTETDLRQAIDHGTFEVHYQPIIAFGSGRIAGFEALARWRHPERGLLFPVDFIDVAEDTGMILDIGRLMLADACGQMAAWRRQFGPAAPDSIAVNVSSLQFSDEGLADEIEAILGRTGLDPGRLKLEITESAFLGDVPAARATLERIQRMGIQWSLDDFGTGYSSLSYLQKLPIDTLKIDRSFVGRIGHETDGFEMIRAIVTLAHNLGMDVVAEGVETIQQAAGLDSLGCEYAQGFYFSRPVDSATAARLIGAQPWRRAGDAGSADDRTATQLSLV